MPDKNANAVNHDDNKVRVFTVKELIGKEFVIPSYQRGYRWGDTQVKQLFDDLRNAYNKGWDSYNLQPLVVTWKANEKKWCVIDGQQRLTTLYLLLTALKQKEDKLWALSYDTRSDSKVFLEKIGDWSYADALKNPDYYHMYEAWEQLRELTLTVDTTAFATKIYENVQFIWYEVNQKNEAETFKRLNSGRIPLSNAELIKAFLHEQKFDNFARDWNMMEHELQRADFWSFINPDPDAERFTALHLDFLFEIWLRCKENAEEERFTAKTLENSPFYIFEQVAKNATEAWEGVKEIFRWCQECYQERTTYHLLGFLMRNRQAVEIRFDKLCELFMTQKGTETRSAFVQSLRNACAKVVMKEDRRELNLDLSYGQDNDAIHQLLLLFNLALTEQQSIEQARFPFDVMRQAMWSLEHIHARQEKIEKEAERCYVEECLEEKKVKSGKWWKYGVTVEDCDGGQMYTCAGLDLHCLGNMALLDTRGNSAFNHGTFLVKQRKLAEWVSGMGESTPKFIPPGTRLVFGHLIGDGSVPFAWTRADSAAYTETIERVVMDFLKLNA